MTPRLLLHAFVAGLLLAAMRAPLGLDLTQLQAVDGTTAALFRASALFAVALFLDPRRRNLQGPFRPGAYLLAVACGVGLGGLFIGTLIQPGSRLGYGLLLVSGTAALRLCAGPRVAPATSGASEPRLPLFERTALVLLGVGLALGLESLAHETRLFTLGLPEEEAVVGVTVLLLTAFGAAAFGPLLARRGYERVLFPGGLLLSLSACTLGLLFLASLTREGLHRYLTRMDVLVVERLRSLDLALGERLGLAGLPALDGTAVGTWWVTVLLTAAAWVAPAFLLGAALACARHPARLGQALFGVGLGVLLRPWLLRAMATPIDFPDQAETPWAWTWIGGGTLLAALSVAALALSSGPGRPRTTGLALAGAGLCLTFFAGRPAVWSFSPWHPADVTPRLVVPTTAGYVALESLQGAPPVVTVDRRRVTPLAEAQDADLARLEQSLALVAGRRQGAPLRVLFIGQMTPARAAWWRTHEPLKLDRTAPWFRAFPALEERLFANAEPPPGQVLSPAEARGRVVAGDYDLVLVTEIAGPILVPQGASRRPWAPAPEPVFSGLGVPAGTLAVLWQRGDTALSRRVLPERGLLSIERFKDLTVGLVLGEVPPPTEPDAPRLFALGEPTRRPSGLSLLSLFPRHRDFETQRRLSARLARGALGTEAEELGKGLAAFFALQAPSSPFESAAEQLEFEEQILRDFHADARERTGLDAFTRGLWNDLAWLLTEKRLPHLSVTYLATMAERFAPWPELEIALGTANLELLEPATALEHYGRALAERPQDLTLLSATADAAHEADLPAREIELLLRALELAPDSEELGRRLDSARAALGAPREASAGGR